MNFRDNLLDTVLTNFTDEDWQNVKELVQEMASNKSNDFEAYVAQYDAKDLKKMFVREMMKKGGI